MKIHILFPFIEGPLGGGNQFLKALRVYLRSVNVYAESIDEAEVVLFNSFHDARQVVSARLRYPKKVFVHRVDGAASIYSGKVDARDRVVNVVNDLCADATVFQSHWSRGCVFPAGRKPSRLETVIINAPDPGIFNSRGKRPPTEGGKLRLIAASWSPNWEKGFDVYRWLDQFLDFNRVAMTFVGRSPVAFENIVCAAPMGSRQLAQMLSQADIFITASRNETCPNALLEALHSGLPAVALRSGAHEELLNGAGELFDDPYEIPELIDRIRGRYVRYQQAMNLSTMDAVGRQYKDFCAQALQAGVAKKVTPFLAAYLRGEILVSRMLDTLYYHTYRLFPRKPRRTGRMLGKGALL